MTGLHQLHGVPDLTSENGTLQHAVDDIWVDL
jgi:hypothetical protein